MPRFDEIDLDPAIALSNIHEEPPADPHGASRFDRLFAFAVDLSLFIALTLALMPLLSTTAEWSSVAALGGFLLMLSYYYFVGSWLLWGKTVGGAIFGIRVIGSNFGS